MFYIAFVQTTECLVIKVAQPNHRKAAWLDSMAEQFSHAVHLGLEAAQTERASSRARLHNLVYRPARQQSGLPADYARMAVNAAASLARSYYRLRQSAQHASFPKVNRSQGIGLGVNAYAVVQDGERFRLRVSTGVRGCYAWLALCVPPRYQDRLVRVYGDAKLFKRLCARAA